MKQMLLAAMVMMTVASSASAETNAWDQFWGTDVPMAFKVAGIALDPANTGWDEFFGTTLNPQNTGWDDFWYQCQDPTKRTDDCIGLVAAGIGLVIAAPIVGLTAMNSIGLFGVMAVTGSPAILASPAILGVTTSVATA